MPRPIVAIVGRPNVGKSTLFNRILGWRKAIVDPQSGLTRDRLYGVADWRGREFTVVDTAGLDLDSAQDSSQAAIEAQSKVAIDQADVIVLLLDVRQGLTPIDREIAQLLRRSRRKVIVAANKADSPSERHFAHEILELGFEEPSLLSAQHGLGVGDFLDRVLEALPEPELEAPAEEKSDRLASMERADAVLLVIDAFAGVLAQDQHVAGYALEAGKGLVLVVNKIDLVEPAMRKPAHWRAQLARQFKVAPFAPIVPLSARTREGIGTLIPTALEVVGQRRIKMARNELNRVLREAFLEHPPPSFKGRRLKLGYATQAGSETPTVVLFVNDTGLLHFSYRRYLEKKIRDRFGMFGNPLKLVLRSDTQKRAGASRQAVRNDGKRGKWRGVRNPESGRGLRCEPRAVGATSGPGVYISLMSPRHPSDGEVIS